MVGANVHVFMHKVIQIDGIFGTCVDDANFVCLTAVGRQEPAVTNYHLLVITVKVL